MISSGAEAHALRRAPAGKPRRRPRPPWRSPCRWRPRPPPLARHAWRPAAGAGALRGAHDGPVRVAQRDLRDRDRRRSRGAHGGRPRQRREDCTVRTTAATAGRGATCERRNGVTQCAPERQYRRGRAVESIFAGRWPESRDGARGHRGGRRAVGDRDRRRSGGTNGGRPRKATINPRCGNLAWPARDGRERCRIQVSRPGTTVLTRPTTSARAWGLPERTEAVLRASNWSVSRMRRENCYGRPTMIRRRSSPRTIRVWTSNHLRRLRRRWVYPRAVVSTHAAILAALLIVALCPRAARTPRKIQDSPIEHPKAC